MDVRCAADSAARRGCSNRVTFIWEHRQVLTIRAVNPRSRWGASEYMYLPADVRAPWWPEVVRAWLDGSSWADRVGAFAALIETL